MSLDAVLLVLLATVMHASWNLLVRAKRVEAACFWRMHLAVVALGAPAALAGALLLPAWDGVVTLAVAASGVCCGFYFFCLARAYGEGDFTTVYPAARALPVLAVAAADVLRGRHPSVAGWIGMVGVAVGCFLVPLHSIRELRLARYFNRATLWILGAAAGTVGYSLIDKIAQEHIPRGPASAALYCYWFYACSAAALALFFRLAGHKLPRPAGLGWTVPAAAGALSFASYAIVLSVYQFTSRASYVVALRQFSIVIGVVAGFALFREPGRFVRTAGACVITAGLVLLAVWGR
ncbi:MAG TPA: EamA family transporter [Candidatus Brocadiia bacterium]|nr:EamA family transporter [Candidatus Brocadiia bacterium]